MKFTSLALVLTLASKASGFAPQAAAPAIHGLATKPNGELATEAYAFSTRSTSLNLFGFRSSKFNSPAKVKGEPTEAEIRALFELWNSALATGDSRIVASRYTKVSSNRYLTVLCWYTVEYNLTRSLYHSMTWHTQSPVLLATVSDTPRTNYDSVKDYFDAFLKMKPQGMFVRF